MQVRLVTAALAALPLLAAPASASADGFEVTGACYDTVVVNSDPDAAAVTVLALVAWGEATHPENLPLVYVTCTVRSAAGAVVHESYGGGVGAGGRPDVVVLPGVGYRLCTSSSAFWLVSGGSADGPSSCKDLVG